MYEKVNLRAALSNVEEPWRPRTIARLNNCNVMVVKTKGEFVWHKHPYTDDFFYVVDGQLTIQLRDRDVMLEAGDLFVVPRGVEHFREATTAPQSS